MGHPQPFRVPVGRPSLEQTAHELGMSPSEFKRVTKLVDAVLVGEEGVRLVEHKTQPPRKACSQTEPRAIEATQVSPTGSKAPLDLLGARPASPCSRRLQSPR